MQSQLSAVFWPKVHQILGEYKGYFMVKNIFPLYCL